MSTELLLLRLTPGSVPGNHSLQALLKDGMGYQGLNSGQLRAWQVPDLLYYITLSSLALN